MFTTIYNHELMTWLKKPLFYIYAGILFLLGALVMAVAAGVFDSNNVTVTSNVFINSPLAIVGISSQLALLCYLLIPSITGATIDRDFKNNMHNVLYSYPLTKFSYLLAKFTAGITINMLIVFATILGMMVGTYLPGANEELLGPFNFWNYLQPFLFIYIPNILFYSALVFAIVVFTRNMNLGFMTILTLIIIQLVMVSYVDEVDDPIYIALADPLGNVAIQKATEYLTVAEKNYLNLPFDGLILWNRLLWLGISSLILAVIVYVFNFSQHATSFRLFKSKASRITKQNFKTTNKIVLPQVQMDFSFWSQVKTTWLLAKKDTKYIITGWPFIIIAFLSIVLSLVILNFSTLIYGTGILPKTWSVLGAGSVYFIMFTFLLIFLYSGFLMDRARAAHAHQLVDVTPTPDWVFVLSKGIALLILAATMHTLVILTGIGFQLSSGFYDLQLDLYLFQSYLIDLLRYIPWIFLALFVQTLIKNKWLGMTVLLIMGIAIPLLSSALGIEQFIFDFNGGNNPEASDFSGYSNSLLEFYTYRVYWTLLGLVAFVFTVLYYRRGQSISALERIENVREKWTRPLRVIAGVSIIGFFAIGSYIWYIDNVINDRKSGKDFELLQVNYEKKLSKYSDTPQPKLVAVNTKMDIFPDTRDFSANVTYTLVNRSLVPIDTLHVNVQDFPITIKMNKAYKTVYKNKDFQYRMFRFTKPMQPGDTLTFSFKMRNRENAFLSNQSPIENNGTFLNDGLFPSIGYNDGFEIQDLQLRKKYKLPYKDRMPDQNKPGARDENYIGGNSDWIDFEATVSTSKDQIAIAPGYLIKEWTTGDRRYFHYKMDSKMLNFYSIMSGRYAVKKEMYKGIALEIYHHPEHTYNLDRMMLGLKKGLDYYNANYTPYQHRQARIIEFPKQYGSYAQAFANTIPFSEGVGFIADVDDTDKEAVDYPLSITAHELAHQWWAHQVIGAKVKGATMLSESFSEYSSLKVLEKVYGKNQMRVFLQDAMDTYLLARGSEQNGERPLMYNENQQYIHYQKGSLVLYAMSDYIGEQKFNKVLKQFAEKYQFKSAPYPVTTEFVTDLREVTPDSLQYLIKDMFETITLYDNEVEKLSSKKLPSGKYEVTLTFNISKYRTNQKGRSDYKNEIGQGIAYKKDKKDILSLPLQDYIEVGIFGKEDAKTGDQKVLYLQKRKVDAIHNTIKIIVDSKPEEAGVDPYYKLIDRNTADNRKKF